MISYNDCNPHPDRRGCHPTQSRKAPLQFKRGSAKAFFLQNPVLLEGQPAWEIDTYELKIGDGETRYRDLPYIGHDAKDGKSAYELWQDCGNVGSIDDFLNSLTGVPGKSAYELWLDYGNEGTIEDFFKDLKGVKGDTGKSAYEIWLDQGNTGTEEEFLASIKGEKGDSAYEIWKDQQKEPDATVDEYIAFMLTSSWGKIE